MEPNAEALPVLQITRGELRLFARLIVDIGFDMLTDHRQLRPEVVARAGALYDVLRDYDRALRRLDVTDNTLRQRLVTRLETQLLQGKRVDLMFQLSPNTWAKLVCVYVEALTEHWEPPSELAAYYDEEDD